MPVPAASRPTWESRGIVYWTNRQTTSATQSPPQRVIPVEQRKAFFSGIVRSLKRDLPSDLRSFRNRGDFNLMKVWYDHYRVHYEVVLDQQIGKIEIGLHFEDGPASSMAFLSLLDRRILEIKHQLGPEIELERWTQSWARLYELHPLVELGPDVTERAAIRLGSFISLLQPIVRTADVRLDRPGI
jgi:hypothetical protein